MSENVPELLQKSAYNELMTITPKAKVQISARYGLLTDVLTVTDLALSGTTVAESSMFKVSTGIAADGLATALSKRQMQSKAGIGGLARIDAAFATPAALSAQRAGIQNSEDGAVFEYNGLDFGILYYYGGRDETQTLTVTTGATGIENATIEIDGMPYIVPLTINGGTGTDELHTATEIAESLTVQDPNYLFSANQTDGVVTVIAQSQISGAAGAFSFSSATAIATWFQDVVGESPTAERVTQVDWNGETVEGFDPLMLNVYKIEFNGNIEFSIFNTATKSYTIAHTIKHSNFFTTPLFGNPTFRVGWLVVNFGNTTDIILSGTEAAMFHEGQDSDSAIPLSTENTIASVGVLPTNIIAVRNRFNFNGMYNRADLIVKTLDLTTESTKIGIFELRKNPVFADDMEFFYSDSISSTGEISYTGSAVTGGQLIATFTVKATNPRGISESGLPSLIEILPGDILSLSCRVSANPTALMQATLSGTVDL